MKEIPKFVMKLNNHNNRIYVNTRHRYVLDMIDNDNNTVWTYFLIAIVVINISINWFHIIIKSVTFKLLAKYYFLWETGWTEF